MKLSSLGPPVLSLVSAALFLSGCASKKNDAAKKPAPGKTSERITVSPAAALVGKVVSVNRQLNFVVIDFPPGMLPALSQRLAVYHGPQKVGELKVSGPQRDTIVVADITAGAAEVGDQVRTEWPTNPAPNHAKDAP